MDLFLQKDAYLFADQFASLEMPCACRFQGGKPFIYFLLNIGYVVYIVYVVYVVYVVVVVGVVYVVYVVYQVAQLKKL